MLIVVVLIHIWVVSKLNLHKYIASIFNTFYFISKVPLKLLYIIFEQKYQKFLMEN